MEAIVRQYPEDREAAIFYALALNMAALPSDKSYAKQTRASELLLLALADQPNHPGIVHYLTYCVGDASCRVVEEGAKAHVKSVFLVRLTDEIENG